MTPFLFIETTLYIAWSPSTTLGKTGARHLFLKNLKIFPKIMEY